MQYKKIVPLVFFVLGFVMLSSRPITAEPDDDSTQLEPVEFDIHEYMEYAFEPVFQQLKVAMQKEPSDRKAWVPIKSGALLLAENGNLLMLRPSEENPELWNRLSAELRDEGRELYEAAKTRDYPTTRKRYETFVQKCNTCHQEFADGEHVQEP